MPAIEVYLVQSTEASGGIGEPGSIGAVPPLTNAIFAATGKPWVCGPYLQKFKLNLTDGVFRGSN